MSSKKTAGAVHDAIRKGSLTEVKKCLKKGSSVNETNASKQTPLHTAAIEGQLTILLYLIEKKKCDVNAKDRDGWTPLHCACHSGHLEIVDQLISHDANLNFETSNGSMPLHYFVRMPAQSTRPALFERLFRTMIRKGVNINQQNQQGETPLHMAAFRGKEKSVALLLWNQADPNLKNKYGETPLHLAARAGYSNVLKQLLEVGADYNVAGCNGTAYEIAINNNNQEMIAIFEEKMKPEDKILLQKGLEGKKSKPSVQKLTEKERLDRTQSINDVVYAYPSDNTQTLNHLPTVPFVHTLNQTPAPTPNVQAPTPTPTPTQPAPTPNQQVNPNQPVPQPGYYPFSYNGMPPTGQPPMPYYYPPGYYPGGSAVFTYDPNVPFDPNNPNSYPMNPNNFPPGYPMPFYPNQINPNDPNAQSHAQNNNNNNNNQNQQHHEVNKTVNEPNSHSNILPQSNQDLHNQNNKPEGNNAKVEKPKAQEKPKEEQPKVQSKVQEKPKEEQQPKVQSKVQEKPKPVVDETVKEDEKPKGVSASNRSTLRKKTNTNRNVGSLKKGGVPAEKAVGGAAGGAGPKRNPKANNNNSPASFEPPKLENYHIGELIDRGAFGAVYRGLDIKTGAIVAIKQVPLAGVPPKELQTIMAELNLLKRLENKYIVRYIGFVQDEANINFVMEYIEGGSLAKLIQKFGKLPDTLCAKYVSQVLLGLDYIHRRGVIHRDIKCANILITKDGTVKLADFGIAATPEGQEAEATLKTLKNGDYKNNNSNKEAVGSPYWMAPEIILLEGASTNSDIWSLGSTVIELVSGSPPYIDLAPMAALFAVVQDPHPPIPVDISNDLRDFLLLCFNKQPNERPTARELLKHPFIINNVGDLSSELISSSSSIADFSADLPEQPKANKPIVQQEEPKPKLIANKQPQKALAKSIATNNEGGDQPAGKPTPMKRRQSTPVANQNPAVNQPAGNPVKQPVKQVAKVQVKQTAVKQTINQPANQPVTAANPVKQPANQPPKGPTRAPSKPAGQVAAGGQAAPKQGAGQAAGQGAAGGPRRAPQKQGSGNANKPAITSKEQDINSSIAELKMSADRTFRPYDLDNLPTMTNINVTSILQSFSASNSDDTNDDDKTDEDKTDEDKTDEDKTDEDKTDEEKSDDEEDEEDEQKMQLARTTKQLTELMKWARSAMDSGQGARACKLRTALRKEKKILRSRYRDFTEARELANDIRKLGRECEEKYSDFISLDESDTDYDSEDSFFLADDEDEYDDEFVDGF